MILPINFFSFIVFDLYKEKLLSTLIYIYWHFNVLYKDPLCSHQYKVTNGTGYKRN